MGKIIRFIKKLLIIVSVAIKNISHLYHCEEDAVMDVWKCRKFQPDLLKSL